MVTGAVHKAVSPPAGKARKAAPAGTRRGKPAQGSAVGPGLPAPRPGRTTIQVESTTKLSLDQIKELESLDTYDEVITFLIRERRKRLPSTAGCTPDIGPFVRDEEEDPYRVPR
ncbi:MAG: hypothetical protein ABFC24_06140 [Methanoregulaceae archaeon]